jgi:hypothetical protein
VFAGIMKQRQSCWNGGLVGLARTIYIRCIYGILAGKSQNIRSYTVYIYGSGQPYGLAGSAIAARQRSTSTVPCCTLSCHLFAFHFPFTWPHYSSLPGFFGCTQCNLTERKVDYCWCERGELLEIMDKLKNEWACFKKRLVSAHASYNLAKLICQSDKTVMFRDLCCILKVKWISIVVAKVMAYDATMVYGHNFWKKNRKSMNWRALEKKVGSQLVLQEL